MPDLQIHNERVTCLLFLSYVFSEYRRAARPAFSPGSASNPVVILDDDPLGSALNPVVITDDEPLNPRPASQTPTPVSEDLADAVQDQS